MGETEKEGLGPDVHLQSCLHKQFSQGHVHNSKFGFTLAKSSQSMAI